VTRPRLLDAYCGAGGAAVGYDRAGFDVTGVDIAPQKHFPFAFHQGDAIDFILAHGHEYDAIHASPPCQQYTALRAVHGKEYPDLYAATRSALQEIGKPWVIENVPGAPIHSGIYLCGMMFGLRVYRHRWFETPFLLMQPHHPKHVVRANGHKSQRQRKQHYLDGGFVTITGNVGSYCGDAMDVDWMTGEELSQAIPPAYTNHIGTELLGYIDGEDQRTGKAGHGAGPGGWISVAGHFKDVAVAREAMQIDWMNRDEMAQAIPPAYTTWMGAQLLPYVEPDDE
jgi:DNA (cytosine-5)-methyltransferase 1